MGILGGGSKSKSWNDAAGWVNSTYQPVAQTGVNATNQLAALLGLGGDQEAANAGFQNFLGSTGYNTAVDEAMRGVTASGAARGLLNSGPTGKAYQDRASGLGQQYFTNYLGQLGSVAQGGLNAGQLVTQANQRSKSKESGGLLGGLGALGQGIGGFAALSDRRVKADIRLVGRDADGLGRYSFRYIFSAARHIGVMAQEVALLRPWALGPRVGALMSVRYDMLEAA